VLVLQGGGALGAYQAGAFEGAAAAGAMPDWVCGVSIGAINAALIAGNPPERRVPRLREFWDRVSSAAPLVPAFVLPTELDPVRALFNRMAVTTVSARRRGAAAAEARPAARRADSTRRHQHTVLVLQGGGALGAYQAGAFEGAAAAGAMPDWVCGVSIGAINAALIAGNAPERRVPRLREFWDRVSSAAPLQPPPALDPLRAMFNRVAAGSATLFGIPGFFRPVGWSQGMNQLSFYDTGPLRDTLLELVDFELINRKGVRLSVGAVNVVNGNSVYFDNHKITLRPEHIMASGALPPGFPPVAIDGQHYWDGGIVSNSPLWYVLDDGPSLDALILQVDLFSARGTLPTNIDQVQERHKDIQYSSKTRFNSQQLKEREELKASFRRLLAKLPPALHDDADVKRLEAAARSSEISLVQLINRHDTCSSSVKDYEFSRPTVNQLWAAGLADVQRSVAHVDWSKATECHEGVQVFDLTR
jgi:NTE family protein